MASKIEQLIDDLQDYIDSCKTKFMSNSEIIVNKADMDDLIQDMRKNVPEEIKRYQKIVSNKEAILNDAREKAEKLIKDATIQTNELISEHEIMQKAYLEANEVVTMASNKAQEIIDKATMEANALRESAAAYTENNLAELENVISTAIQNANAHYEGLISTLSQSLNVIQTNREACHPMEETFEEIPMSDATIPDESNQ